jgi:hypothetical protein
MTQDTHTTLMIFKKFPEGDVIALMPDEIADPYNNIMSYQRIGQHGVASPELINELKDATKRERAALKRELKGLGYLIKEGN